MTSNLLNQDCLDFLTSLPKKSIDLIITDPPYFIGFDRGDGWDKQWKSSKEYLIWCQKWTNQCVRVLKDNRMLIVWGTLKNETFLQYKLQTSKNHKDTLFPQNEIIWSYNWGGRTKNNFPRKHEFAFVWSKGKEFIFNRDDVLISRKMTKNIRTGENYKEDTLPTCVWEKNNHTTSKDYIGWHPTTKNLDVTIRLIKAYSNPEETVLDCFMGSGTTAIAAIRCNRKYLGCEISPQYFQKTISRIEKEIK